MTRPALPANFDSTTDCAYCRDRRPEDARCEVHRLHTEPAFREAYEITDGRFQVFVYPDVDEKGVTTRNRTLCDAVTRRDAEFIAKALAFYLDSFRAFEP